MILFKSQFTYNSPISPSQNSPPPEGITSLGLAVTVTIITDVLIVFEGREVVTWVSLATEEVANVEDVVGACGMRIGEMLMEGKGEAMGLENAGMLETMDGLWVWLVKMIDEVVGMIGAGIDEVVGITGAGVDEVVGITGATLEEVGGTGALLVAGLLLPPAPYVATLEGPVGTSPSRTQPVLAVRAAGHSTCTKSTVGLLAPSNQSYLHEHPA